MLENCGRTLEIRDADTDEYDDNNNDNLFIGRLRSCVSVGASQLAWVNDRRRYTSSKMCIRRLTISVSIIPSFQKRVSVGDDKEERGKKKVHF